MLQASLRTALRSRRDVDSVGPFLVAFDADSDSPFRNYAIPDPDSHPTREEVYNLRRVFRERARRPRLEFLPEAAPAVAAALMSAGFVTEARLPIMTCSAGDLRAVAPPPGVVLEVVSGDAALREAAGVQNAAYGGPAPTQADITRLEHTVTAGGVVGLARVGSRGIGSGLVVAPSEGCSELAAVGVLPDWRRRGVAAALTGALGRAAFDRGTATLMLMAYEAERDIYGRAGFTVASEIVFVSMPS